MLTLELNYYIIFDNKNKFTFGKKHEQRKPYKKRGKRIGKVFSNHILYVYITLVNISFSFFTKNTNKREETIENKKKSRSKFFIERNE